MCTNECSTLSRISDFLSVIDCTGLHTASPFYVFSYVLWYVFRLIRWSLKIYYRHSSPSKHHLYYNSRFYASSTLYPLKLLLSIVVLILIGWKITNESIRAGIMQTYVQGRSQLLTYEETVALDMAESSILLDGGSVFFSFRWICVLLVFHYQENK